MSQGTERWVCSCCPALGNIADYHFKMPLSQMPLRGQRHPPRARPLSHRRACTRTLCAQVVRAAVLVGCHRPATHHPSGLRLRTLAPALYALGQHDAVAAADAQLRPRECLAWRLFSTTFTSSLHPLGHASHSMSLPHPSRREQASPPISAKSGCATALEDQHLLIAELGAGVWRGDAHETEHGFVGLGTPIRHPRFVAAHTNTPLLDSRRGGYCMSPPCYRTCSVRGCFLPCVPRRVLIICCAPSRPTFLASYMRVATTTPSGDACPRCLARRTLPTPRSPTHAASQCCRGLGLQCAACTAPAAYWAAWADALRVLRARRPDAAARCLAELTLGRRVRACC